MVESMEKIVNLCKARGYIGASIARPRGKASF